VPNFTSTGVMVEREEGWWTAGITPMPSTCKEEGADERDPHARGGACARERERGVADEWGRADNEGGESATRAHEEMGRERRGTGAREGGGGSRPWAGVGPAERGGEVFLFSFFLFFSLIPFLLYTNIHLYFLGAKMKCYV
jgi:hypothetical protein